jgi:hypothetical protein
VDLITPEQAMGETSVRDKTFYKCTIHGPAILTPRETRFVGGNEFFRKVPRHEHPDSLLYPLDPIRTRKWFIGTIGVRDCVFHDCTFVDVGFMQDEPAIVKLKHHMAGGGDVEI